MGAGVMGWVEGDGLGRGGWVGSRAMGWVAEQKKGKSGGDGPSRAECGFRLIWAILTMWQLRQMRRFAGDSISGRKIGRMLGVARSRIQYSWKHA